MAKIMEKRGRNRHRTKSDRDRAACGLSGPSDVHYDPSISGPEVDESRSAGAGSSRNARTRARRKAEGLFGRSAARAKR